jgi:hypothetical protein
LRQFAPNTITRFISDLLAALANWTRLIGRKN